MLGVVRCGFVVDALPQECVRFGQAHGYGYVQAG
jgi:hypothetical protein